MNMKIKFSKNELDSLKQSIITDDLEYFYNYRKFLDDRFFIDFVSINLSKNKNFKSSNIYKFLISDESDFDCLPKPKSFFERFKLFFQRIIFSIKFGFLR